MFFYFIFVGLEFGVEGREFFFLDGEMMYKGIWVVSLLVRS